MAHSHFVFRLTEESAAVILTALEGRFLQADQEERKKIAGVTMRLRRKLKSMNVTREVKN